MNKNVLTTVIIGTFLLAGGTSWSQRDRVQVSQTDILRDFCVKNSRWPTSLTEMERFYLKQKRPDYVKYLVEWNDCSAVILEPNANGSLSVKTWTNRLILHAGNKPTTRLETIILSYQEKKKKWPDDRNELEEALEEWKRKDDLKYVRGFSVLDFREVFHAFKGDERDLLIRWDTDQPEKIKVGYLLNRIKD